MDKAPDAFRTISEVAEDLDLPQHVLRFWETRFPQIKPLKRGGGRRYYRPDDVLLLRGIRHLLYGEGYTIKGVQRILKEGGVRAVQVVWQTDGGEAEPAPLPQAVEMSPTGFVDDDDDIDLAAPLTEDLPAPAPVEAAPPMPAPPTELSDPFEPEPEAEQLPLAPVASHMPPQSASSAQRPATVSMVRGGIARAAGRLDMPPVPASQEPGISADEAQSLKAVLYELLETRKALEQALNRR